MLPYRLFVLVVAFMCPVFGSAIPSRALAGSDSTSGKGPGGYCTDYIAVYSPNEEAWMKFHYCIWVNPDKSALLVTYIDDVQYWKGVWYRPSKYDWRADARSGGETLASGSGAASGTNVKNDIGKIDDSIKPGRHQWYIGLSISMSEASQDLRYNHEFTFDIDSE